MQREGSAKKSRCRAKKAMTSMPALFVPANPINIGRFYQNAEELLQRFLDCDCARNRHTDHRVVARADKTHHFNVCGNG